MNGLNMLSPSDCLEPPSHIIHRNGEHFSACFMSLNRLREEGLVSGFLGKCRNTYYQRVNLRVLGRISIDIFSSLGNIQNGRRFTGHANYFNIFSFHCDSENPEITRARKLV